MLRNYTNEGERGRIINHTRELHQDPLGGYLKKSNAFSLSYVTEDFGKCMQNK